MSITRRGRKANHVADPGLPVDLGREICTNLEAGEKREWLVTNGMGGFASGTVAGLVTRRYHSLLMAALKPPLGRTLLVTKIDEIAEYGEKTFSLGANRWVGGAIDPKGYEFIQRFHLEGATPVWTFACADALLEKRIWMEQGANTTYVTYKLVRASHPLRLALKVLVNYRDFHSSTRAGDWRMDIQPVEHGLRVIAYQGATPFYLLSPQAAAYPAHNWYRDYDHPVERFRGLDDREDNLHAATFGASIDQGDEITLVFSTEPSPALDAREALDRRQNHERSLVDHWIAAHPAHAATTPPWVRQLLFAEDQFIVRRPLAKNPEAHTVIAGYHWFGDWGRDTMIALPGLALTTRRYDLAANVLRTFARFVSQGMLPNRFPDSGEHAEGAQPEYNTVDATLWYFHAIDRYIAASGDQALARELLPVLDDIVAWHVRGTRYNIHVDPGDGLLFAGQPSVQLTWMDAKVGDWVVTPRIGKPVEINALWINALRVLHRLHLDLGVAEPQPFEAAAERAAASFERFWYSEGGYLYDVIDGPDGSDAALRPNQLLAVSLPNAPITGPRARAIVEACARHLLTSYGLRSLSPEHPSYIGRYGGDQKQRDAAYHQGTVWAWLIGAFVDATLKAYAGDVEVLWNAQSILAPFEQHLADAGLGSISEIFEADAPFGPVGCVAQAWSVAEVLRAWVATAPANLQAGQRQPQDH